MCFLKCKARTDSVIPMFLSYISVCNSTFNTMSAEIHGPDIFTSACSRRPIIYIFKCMTSCSVDNTI